MRFTAKRWGRRPLRAKPGGAQPARRSHTRTRALLAVFLVAACAAPLVPKTTPGATPAAELSRDQTVSLLAESGIAVVEDIAVDTAIAAVQEPRSPLKLTVRQAENLQRNANSRGGIPGAELDRLGELAGMPDGAPPFSYLVAGWASGFDSAGAIRARALMPDEDWRHPDSIVFSHLVLTLFVSDVARDEAAGSNSSLPIGLLAGPGQADANKCPLTGWIDSILSSLFDLLKVESNGEGVAGVFAIIWNLAVELAQEVVTGLIKVLTAPVLAAIRTTVAIIGTTSFIASLVAGYEISVEHVGGAVHFAHFGEGDQEGVMTASVASPLGDWPGYLVACASDAGIALPDTSPPGKAVRWQTISNADISLASVVTSDTAVSSDSTADLKYVTSREPEQQPPLSDHDGRYRVIAYVEMFTDADLQALTDKLVFTGTAGNILKGLLGDLFDEAYNKIQELAEENGEGRVRIGWHEASPTPTPTPTPTSTATATPTATPTASPTAPRSPANFRLATATVLFKGAVYELENGFCNTELAGGSVADVSHYWQIWFVEPNATVDLFYISIESPVPVGAGTVALDSFFSGPGTGNDLAEQSSIEIPNVIEDNINGSVVLQDVVTRPGFEGPSRGVLGGTVVEDDEPITVYFNCFGPIATPSPSL